jgi:copper transport protein
VSILVLFTPGLAGHPAAAPGNIAVFLIISDWLHLLAASPWIAGLWVFVFLLPRVSSPLDQPRRAMLTMGLVDRFPRVAVVAVALLVVSGVFAAVQHIPNWQGLVHTNYGLTILTKSALLIPVLILAATHHLMFKRRAQRLIRTGDVRETLSRFRTAIRFESLFVALILLAAGLLVNLPPAEASLAAHAGKSFEQSQQTEGVHLNLKIRPARVGLNSVEVRILQHESSIDLAQLQPRITAEMLSHRMGREEISLKRVSTDEFRADGVMLGMTGPWELTVVAALQDGRELHATFRLYVPPAGQ